jgi:AraC family transcriptional regulator of arabinose operon
MARSFHPPQGQHGGSGRVEVNAPVVSTLITGDFQRGPGYVVWRSQGTRDWLLTCTYGGCGRFGHALGEILAEPGHLVLLRPGARHDYSVLPGADARWDFLWTHVHPRPAWSELLDWPAEAPGLFHLDLSASPRLPWLIQRLRDMHLLATGIERRREEFAMNALEEALLWIDLENPRHAPGDPRLRAAMDHACRNLDAELTLARLAEIAGLSPSRFAARFRARFGEPPMRWLEHQRLARACDLLAVTSEAIAEVAARVGFRDPYHFSRRFRAFTGQGPRAWRQARA